MTPRPIVPASGLPIESFNAKREKSRRLISNMTLNKLFNDTFFSVYVFFA